MLKEYFLNRATERSTGIAALFALSVAIAHFTGAQLSDAFDIGASIAAALHAAIPGD